jgi:hypothetical protein
LVCGKHFTPSCFYHNRKKIKQDAIPTLFLNGNEPSNKFLVKILSHHKKTPPQTSDDRIFSSPSPSDLLTKHEPCEAPKVVPILEFSSPWRFTADPPENSMINVCIPNMHASFPNVSDHLCNDKILLLDEIVNLKIQLKRANEKYLRLHDIHGICYSLFHATFPFLAFTIIYLF